MDDYDLEKERLNKLLKLEPRGYNNVLQWGFHDSLFNFTLKQILFLIWMERNCLNVCFLLYGNYSIYASTDNVAQR